MKAGAMLRGAWWAVVLLVVASSVAPAATNGLLSGNVTTRNGQVVSGCYVYVYDTGTTTLATLYTDYAGTVSAGNPVTTDADGEYWVYMTPGGYDVNYVHAGRQIDVWKYGVPTSVRGDVFTTVTVTGAARMDTLRSVNGDTVHVRAWDNARHGVLVTNQLVLEDALGHGSDRAAIRFGPVTGTENPNARVYLPYYGVFWMTRAGYEARVPKYDRTLAAHSTLGIGGTTGRATNFQFWEDVELVWAFADAESTAADTAGLRYMDRPVIGFGRRSDDAAYGADTLYCNAYQSLNITNDRADTLSWMWGKTQAQQCIGPLGGKYGVPDYAIRLQTDFPDSNGTDGERTAVQIRWWMTPSARRIRNADSSFLTMLEHDTENYVFCRDHFELRPSKEGSVNKDIRFYGSAGSPTKLKLADGEGAFLIYLTNSTLQLRGPAGADDGTVDVNTVDGDNVTINDMLKLPVHSLASAWPTDIGPGSMFMSEGDTVYVRNQADNAYFALN